jgi:hypothetical protein
VRRVATRNHLVAMATSLLAINGVIESVYVNPAIKIDRTITMKSKQLTSIILAAKSVKTGGEGRNRAGTTSFNLLNLLIPNPS